MTFAERARVRGYTLVEMLITVGIIGIIFAVVPQFFLYATRFSRLNTARIEVQRDARSTMDRINRNLREAVATTIVVDYLDTPTAQPPYSRIRFTKITGERFAYYQQGNVLYESVTPPAPSTATKTRKMVDNLMSVGFSMPRSDSMSLVSISITLAKKTYGGQNRTLQMAVDKVKIMN